MSHSTSTTASVVPLARLLPSLHGAAVRLQRALRDGRLQSRLLPWGSKLTVDAEPHLLDHSCEICLTSPDGRLGLELSKWEFPALAFACTIDEPSRRNAAARLLLANQLERLADIGWAVRDVALNPTCDRESWTASVGIQWADLQANVLLPSACDRLLAAAEAALALHGGNKLALPDAPLRPRLRIGFQDVASATLRDLRPGDVLVGALAALGRPVAGTVYLVLDGGAIPTYCLRCRIERTSVTMEHPAGRGAECTTEACEEHDRTMPEAEAPVPLEDLALRVHVELAMPVMTLSELASWSPGHVMELDRPLEGAGVQLRINGQLWARGELVAVGEQLGVRITSIGGCNVRPR